MFGVDIQIIGVGIEKVYSLNSLASLLTQNYHEKNLIHDTCNKLSKCVGILCKARKLAKTIHNLVILHLCLPIFNIL